MLIFATVFSELGDMFVDLFNSTDGRNGW